VRLAAAFWVAAYRARLTQAGISAYVTARGDETAGAVIVKVADLAGGATLYGRVSDLEGRRAWETLAEGAEAEVDAAIARQRRADPDLWVVEVEDRQGRSLLDLPGLD